jgi:hypothetical protein
MSPQSGVRRLPITPLAVAAALALLLAGDLLCVALWGRNIALAEDWEMVPAMTGHEPDLLGWVWSQNNEHRLPVQRLIYLGLLRATGDFRSGMIANQMLLASLSAVLAWTAAKARGRWRWSDILFPLALLHIGHWENLIWSWQIQFVWSVFVTGLLIVLVVRAPHWQLTGILAATVLLVLLPISGANGIVMAAAMAIWLAAQAIAQVRAGLVPGDRWAGAALLVSALLCFVVIGVYFIGYEKPEWSPPLASPVEFVRATAYYFSYALGPGSRRFLVPCFAFVVLFTAMGGALASYAAAFGPREGRLRAFGLTLFIAAGVALGAAIALARGALPVQLPDRYALFSVLNLLAAVFAWELYAAKRVGGLAQGALAAALLVLLPLNILAGFDWRNWYVSGMTKVEADIAAGASPAEMARRHYGFLKHWDEPGLHEAIGMLREKGIGPFVRLNRD